MARWPDWYWLSISLSMGWNHSYFVACHLEQSAIRTVTKLQELFIISSSSSLMGLDLYLSRTVHYTVSNVNKQLTQQCPAAYWCIYNFSIKLNFIKCSYQPGELRSVAWYLVDTRWTTFVEENSWTSNASSLIITTALTSPMFCVKWQVKHFQLKTLTVQYGQFTAFCLVLNDSAQWPPRGLS